MLAEITLSTEQLVEVERTFGKPMCTAAVMRMIETEQCRLGVGGWVAWWAGDFDSPLCGLGATEQLAVDDLLAKTCV
jgi:hypothetical protein